MSDTVKPQGEEAVPSTLKARFDRSERLWGAAAQQRLFDGGVCLLGATATGAEILKNAILPGLGRFYVVDDAAVRLDDLGSNFFLPNDESTVGKNIAEQCVPILNELNPLSKGEAITVPVGQPIAEGLQWFQTRRIQVIIASGRVTLGDYRVLAKTLEGSGIALIHAKANGLLGTIRIQADNQYIIQTMTDAATLVVDLRALNPYPTLEAWFEKHNPDHRAELDALDKERGEEEGSSYAHIPWPCIVWHALRKWRKTGDRTATSVPNGGAEWKEVKEIIGQWKISVQQGSKTVEKLQDCFIEAQNNCSARLDLTKRNRPELKEILEDSRGANPTKADHPFWFLVHGLIDFKKRHNVLPQAPSIPDFTATTSMFSELKKIFAEKAAQDANEIYETVIAALARAGMPAETVTKEEVADFASQAWELRYVTYPTVADEYPIGDATSKITPMNPDNFSNGASDYMGISQAFRWYAVLRAAMVYREQHGVEPGDDDDLTEEQLEDVAQKLNTIAQTIFPAALAWGADPAEHLVKECREVTRFGGGETVCVAAIIGAVASQEVIKLIQNRRVPASYCLVFDGMVNHFVTIGA